MSARRHTGSTSGSGKGCPLGWFGWSMESARGSSRTRTRRSVGVLNPSLPREPRRQMYAASTVSSFHDGIPDTRSTPLLLLLQEGWLSTAGSHRWRVRLFREYERKKKDGGMLPEYGQDVQEQRQGRQSSLTLADDSNDNATQCQVAWRRLCLVGRLGHHTSAVGRNIYAATCVGQESSRWCRL